MNVVNPEDSSHVIAVIPRYYDFGETVLTLSNSIDDDEIVTHTTSVTNGILSISFDFTFVERDKYDVKLTEGTEVVYRGKLFATEQEAQDFDITVNYISYE
jgi:hypothetical protein